MAIQVLVPLPEKPSAKVLGFFDQKLKHRLCGDLNGSPQSFFAIHLPKRRCMIGHNGPHRDHIDSIVEDLHH